MGEGLAGVPGVNLFCCCFFFPAVNLNKKQGLILKAAERFGSHCLFVCFLMETSCWLCVCVCVCVFVCELCHLGGGGGGVDILASLVVALSIVLLLISRAANRPRKIRDCHN